MVWTAPRTWVAAELVTAAMMNTHIRDNLNALKAPPTDLYDVNEGADYTVTATSFTDVDATDLALSITTTGGDVLIWFSGSVSHSSANGGVWFEVSFDGVGVAGDDGITLSRGATAGSTGSKCVSIVWLEQSVAAGTHTIKLQWKVGTGTGTMWAGAGTSTFDLHPQFGCREIS